MIRDTLLPRLVKNAVYVAGSFGAVVAALIAVGVLLATTGRNPIDAYLGILKGGLGSWFAISESLVTATPLLLCGLSVAIASRVGLMNIGGEGQLYLGAIGSTYVALAMPGAPAWQLLPMMLIAACLAGAAWSGIPGVLRAAFGINETIVSLLLNYVAILLVNYLVHGPWQDPHSYSWPQTASISAAAELPNFFDSRLHAGILIGLATAVVVAVVFARTHIGFVSRFIGNNTNAAQHAHYRVATYFVAAMLVSGAVAAMAGFGQISAIEGRLRPGISPGYGYAGFLVAWLSRNNPLAIVFVAILMGVLMSGGDALQLEQGLPFATVNILQGCIFLFLLCSERFIQRQALKVSRRLSHD